MLTFDSPLPALEARAREAFRIFEESRRALYRPDGTKRLVDVEHDEKYGAIRAALRQDLQNVRHDIERFRDDAQRQLSAAENAPPSTLLTTTELERANALRDFAADDLASLSHDDLLARLQAVRDAGDNPERFAYLVAGRKHARELAAKMSPPDEAGRSSLGAALDGAVPNDLSDLLDGLNNALTPQSRRIELNGLRSRLVEARGALELVQSLHHGQENYVDAALAVSYGNYLPPGAVRVPRGSVSS